MDQASARARCCRSAVRGVNACLLTGPRGPVTLSKLTLEAGSLRRTGPDQGASRPEAVHAS